jgi:hypothetical protein
MTEIPNNIPTIPKSPGSNTVREIRSIESMGVRITFNKDIHILVSIQPIPTGSLYTVISPELPSLSTGETEEMAMEVFESAIVCYYFVMKNVKFEYMTEQLKAITAMLKALIETVDIDEDKMQ